MTPPREPAAELAALAKFVLAHGQHSPFCVYVSRAQTCDCGFWEASKTARALVDRAAAQRGAALGVDAELVNATLAELQESPLPGARYAYEVVKRRLTEWRANERADRDEALRRIETLPRFFESYAVHGSGTCLRTHRTGEWLRYADVVAALRSPVAAPATEDEG